jgi:hypothetical protein
LALTVALAIPALARYQDDAASLAGAFTVTIGPEEVPAGLVDGPALAGQWTLTFDDDGAFSLARQDVGEVVSGAFEAGPTTLAIREWTGIIGCGSAEGDATATYAWRQADDRLTLTPIDDTCAERLALLTTHPFGSFEACAPPQPTGFDPFAAAASDGTPVSGTAPGRGVAAQEGYSEGSQIEGEIDGLLRQAGGCWATGDPERFMALHSQGLLSQLAAMGPADEFTRELQTFMQTPLRFERVGEVHLDDPDHAWAYVEVDLGDQPLAQRVNFVQEGGVWLFDSFILFGPPLPGGPPIIG